MADEEKKNNVEEEWKTQNQKEKGDQKEKTVSIARTGKADKGVSAVLGRVHSQEQDSHAKACSTKIEVFHRRLFGLQ